MAQWMMHLPHKCEGLGSDLQKPEMTMGGPGGHLQFQGSGGGDRSLCGKMTS